LPYVDLESFFDPESQKFLGYPQAEILRADQIDDYLFAL